jgi:hypothetical protein
MLSQDDGEDTGSQCSLGVIFYLAQALREEFCVSSPFLLPPLSPLCRSGIPIGVRFGHLSKSAAWESLAVRTATCCVVTSLDRVGGDGDRGAHRHVSMCSWDQLDKNSHLG